MGYQGLSRRPLQHARAQVTRERAKTQNCRSLGGTLHCPGDFGESGSALVYAVVLFGLLAIILTGAISQEGSAQVLNIQTGQRRKALDLARGAIDEMLKALFEHGFDLTKCPDFSYVSGISEITRENPIEKWTATATAYKDLSDCIWVVGEAKVVEVSATVRVKLKPCSLSNLFPDSVLVAGSGLSFDLDKKSEGANIFGNVCVGDEWPTTEVPGEVNIYGDVNDGHRISVPAPNEVMGPVQAVIDGKENEGSWWDLGQEKHITIEHDTKAKNLSIPGNGSLVVEQGAWLYVQGSFSANGNPDITIDGVLVVGGHINLGAGDDVPISGNGTIICLGDNGKSKITLGQGNWGGISIICAGELELSFVGAPEVAPPSLFAYARKLDVNFETAQLFEIDPCCLISPENVTVKFKDAGLVQLYAGEFQWEADMPIHGGLYRIAGWTEGKGH
jgi:hypothetical protein